MTQFKRNLSRIVVFTCILLLGAGISGGIYYLKIKQNEDALNTLQFRELNQIAAAFQQSLQKVQSSLNFLVSAPQCSPASTEKDCKDFVNTRLEQMRQSSDLSGITYLHSKRTDTAEIKESAAQETADDEVKTVFSVDMDSIITFTSTRSCSDKARCKVAFISSISLQSDALELISEGVQRFPFVLLAKADGSVIAQRKFALKDSSMSDIRIEKLTPLDKRLDNTNEVLSSNMQDIVINQKDVRMYVQPIPGHTLSSKDETFYLVGLVPIQDINYSKLSVSPNVLMWLIIAIILLLSFTPLLKLRFVNTKYAFTQSDKSQTVLGLVMSVGILSIAVNQHLFFDYLKQIKLAQSEKLFKEINADFNIELNALVNKINSQSAKFNPTNASLFMSSDNIAQDGPESYYTNALVTQTLLIEQQNYTGLIEQLGIVNSEGLLSNQYPVFYASTHLFITSKLSLAHRAYVKAGAGCDFWQDVKERPCQHGFFVERINNIEDGRKNSMIALPSGLGGTERNTLIASTRIRSLVDRIMPRGFGFAVIDENGLVQYHSNDERSLVENFILETNNNPQFMIANKHAQASDSPMNLELDYKGEPHLLSMGKLKYHPSDGASIDNPLPWRLIVFYDPFELSLNNMLLVFLAIVIFISILLPAFFLLRYATQQRFWVDTLYFQEKKAKRYAVWAFYLFSVIVFVISTMGIVNQLSLRLMIWLISCLGVISVLHRRLKVDLRPFHFHYFPQTSLLIMLIVVVTAHYALSSSLSFSPIASNFISLIIGVVFLTVGYLSLIKRSKTSPSSSQKIHDKYPLRARKKVDDRRYTRGFICYLCMLTFLAGAVPGILISHSTNAYLLQRQAELELDHIHLEIDEGERNIRAYIDMLQMPSNETATYGLKYIQAANSAIEKLVNPRDEKSLITKIYPDEVIRDEEQTQCNIACLISNIQNDTKWLGMPQSINDKNNTLNYTDNLIDSIFSTLAFESDFGAHLSFFAKQDLDNEHTHTQQLVFRPDSLMLAASSAHYGLVFSLVCLLLVFTYLYYTIKYLLAQRLTGEHIPDHFRVVRPFDNPVSLKQRQPCLFRIKAQSKAKPVLLLNATVRETKACLDSMGIDLYDKRIKDIPSLLSSEDGGKSFLAHFENSQESHIIALSGIEQAATHPQHRRACLQLLSSLLQHEQIRLILVADTAPLYRLLRPSAYQQQSAEGTLLGEDEIISWTKLFAEFDKEYLWLPVQKKRLANPVDLNKLLAHEAKGWQALAAIKHKFLEYHHNVKQRAKGEPLSHYWMPEQIIEFFLVQAGPLYRQQWELCTIDEKLALWHLAHGANINPANTQVLEHLVRRGFIYRDKGWHIINESFRRFVLSAEDEQTIGDWIESNKTGIWPIIRVPIFAIFIVLVLVLYYSSGDSFTSIIGVATATLGLIPLILKNLNLVRGDSLPEMS